MTLKLQYRCTDAEMKEAKTLQELDAYGRGSKWRGRVVLGGLVLLAAVGTAIRFQREIAPQDRQWFFAVCAVAFLALLVFKRLTRRKTEGTVQLDISEHDVVMGDGNARTVMQWAAFSQCLESPNLFVLLNRSKTTLFVLPKRVFPDDKARDWFRAQANQPKGLAGTVPADTLVPGRFVAANGIAVTRRPKFRDYLNRNVTSWRMKGLFLAILTFVTGVVFITPPPPHAVNSPAKTFLIMAPILLGMMLAMIVLVSFYYWLMERKHLSAEQVVVNDAGIEFVARDSSGRLPWNTYKYYLENRWSFFLWRPQGSLWLMLPKRDFASPSDLAQFRALLQTKLKRSRWFYM